MSVLKCNDMLDTVRSQKFKHLGGCQLISNVPAILVKPFPYCRKKVLRENMYMGVNDGGKTRRNLCIFLIIN